MGTVKTGLSRIILAYSFVIWALTSRGSRRLTAERITFLGMLMINCAVLLNFVCASCLWNGAPVPWPGDDDLEAEVGSVLPIGFAGIDEAVAVGVFKVIWNSVRITVRRF